jgi:hypothetical protein
LRIAAERTRRDPKAKPAEIAALAAAADEASRRFIPEALTLS